MARIPVGEIQSFSLCEIFQNIWNLCLLNQKFDSATLRVRNNGIPQFSIFRPSEVKRSTKSNDALDSTDGYVVTELVTPLKTNHLVPIHELEQNHEDAERYPNFACLLYKQLTLRGLTWPSNRGYFRGNRILYLKRNTLAITIHNVCLLIFILIIIIKFSCHHLKIH